MSLEGALVERFAADVKSLVEGGTSVIDAIGEAAGAVVADAADFGEDLTVAARGAVAGAIVASADLVVTAEAAAAAAANGAINAAADVSSNAAGRVRDVVVGFIEGTKVVVDEVVN